MLKNTVPLIVGYLVVLVAYIGCTTAEGNFPNSKHIVNGTNAQPGEFPSLVRILTEVNGSVGITCTGALISDRWIATSAQCIQNQKNVRYAFVAGLFNLNVQDGNEQARLGYSNIIIHPEFNPTTFQNDIALVKVDPPYMLTNFVQPIQIPIQGYQPPLSTVLFIAGWGSNDTLLQKRQMGLATNVLCSVFHNGIRTGMICTGALADGCPSGSDLGGPLIETEKNSILGIVSWGYERCGYPPVYTSIPYYSNWIKESIQ